MGKFEMVAARNWAAAEHRKSTDALAQGRGQTATGCFARDLHARLLAASTAYRRAEEGVIAIFTLFMFVVIIILAGIGVDFMRHETLRTELQGTLDRAVLAAANLENTLDAEGVVTDYFEKAGLIEFLDDVKMIPENNGRTMARLGQGDGALDLFTLCGDRRPRTEHPLSGAAGDCEP